MTAVTTPLTTPTDRVAAAAETIRRRTVTFDQLTAVVEERRRQDDRWGGPQTLAWSEWVGILAEEVGELAAELNHLRWVGESDEVLRLARTEAVQVAAVAVRIAEQLAERLVELDRGDR